MKNQNFYMRVLCLVVIIGAVLFYNSRTQEKEYQTQNEELTKRIDALEKQQQEILTALQENFDAQEKAKAESEYDIFNKNQRIDSDFDKEVRGMLGEK